MEKAVIDTVEAGYMTKDLAICVHGWSATEVSSLAALLFTLAV
jgi:isocitrate dehydrogenase